MGKQYAERDIVALDEAGDYYVRHVSAMTAESLHSKSDIAAELAWRDYQIDDLSEELKAQMDWRRLALQFDGHRMQAMSMLKMVATGQFDIEEVRQFIAAAPVSGNEHLRQIRAEGSIGGFVAGFGRRSALGPLRKCWSQDEIKEMASEHADRVLRGEVE